MAKGPIVTDAVKACIIKVYEDHKKWKAWEIKKEASDILHEKNTKLPPDWPSLSAVQKVLATIKKKKGMPVDLRDKPWGAATMVKYPIPAEALPTILQLWVWIRENQHVEFTIRQAQWAARFYTITNDMNTLAAMAREYALHERVYGLMGVPYGSSQFADLAIFELMTGQEISPEREKKIIGVLEEGEEMLFTLRKYARRHKALKGKKGSN